MAENSVGEISLELKINNKIEKQLDEVKKNVESPAKQVGENIEKAIEKPLENIDSSVEQAVSRAIKRIDEQNAKIVKMQDSSTQKDFSPKKYKVYDTAAIEKEINEYGSKIDSQFQTIFDRLKDFKIPTTPIERLKTELENTRAKSDLLKAEWEQLKNADPSEKTTAKMLSLQQQIIATDKATERLESDLKKAVGSETAAAANAQFQGIFDRLKSFKIPTTPVERLKAELENTRTKTALLQRQWQELSAAEPSEKVASQMLRIQQQIISTKSSAERLERKIADLGNSGRKLKIIKTVGSKAFGILKSVGGKALDSLKRRFGFLNKSAISLTKPVKKLGRMLKNTFRRVFVMATLYAAVKAIKKSFTDIMKSNDELSKSLNEVKANLSIAFTPIIQAVMPALNTMMSGLARTTKYIAGFIAGLFGMTYKQAAEATKKLHNTGKQAADTAKKVSMSMAGIDEMNILSDNSDDSKNEEDTGIDYDSLDMSEPEFPDWAERLKQAIKSGDWYGVGEVLAERVNAVFGGIDWKNVEKRVTDGANRICDGINGFVDNINWEYLGNALAGGINTITSVINSFADNIHWKTIGSGLANGLNQAVNKIKWKQLGRSMSVNIRILTDLIYSFVTEFDWKELGKGIGEAVNGWFDGIDFEKLGTTLSEGIKGIFSTIKSALQTVDFGSIGRKIAEFVNNIDIVGILSEFASSVSGLVTGLLDFLINFIEQTDWFSLGGQIFNGISGMLQNIDWTGLIERIAKLLGSAIGGASALISSLLMNVWEVLKQAWNSVKDYFNKKIEECGGNVFRGVLKGILDAVKNIGNWIKEHIFKPFIDGFKKAFGIHSPSKEMTTMGGFIIDGLFNAISDGIAKIREIFEKMLDVIKAVFLNIDKWFNSKFSSAWEKIKFVWNNVNRYFSDIWNGIKDTFSTVGNWLGDKFRNAWDNITEIFCNIGSWFSDRWNDITEVFSAVGAWFGDHFTDAWNRIKNAFSSVWEFFNDKWENIKSIFSGVGDWFNDKFSNALDNIKNAFSGIGSFFYGIWEDVSDKATDGMNWLIERIENGLNRIIDGLNWFGFDLPDVMGGGHVGFDLNYVNLPRLANGGLATAPTLAMVGDNRNAKTDPEVIAPLSKLEGMLGGNSEITELLKVIIELLKSGMNIEIINYMFRNSHEFSREVIRAVAEDNARRGGK